MKRNHPYLLAAALAISVAGVAAPSIVTPAIAQQSVGVQTRDTYLHDNEGTFEEWGKKVDAFNKKAAQRGTETKDAAKREVDNAWAETKAGWTKLKSASKDGWEDAKASFEASKKKLERAWDKAQS